MKIETFSIKISKNLLGILIDLNLILNKMCSSNLFQSVSIQDI